VSGFIRALGVDLPRHRGHRRRGGAGLDRHPDPCRERPPLRARRPPAFAAQQPIERLLEPAEIAEMIAWICGPGGAAVTGTRLSVTAASRSSGTGFIGWPSALVGTAYEDLITGILWGAQTRIPANTRVPFELSD